jgi:outer membrane protein assembly factor BamB/orotate phosphoribosyltransferase
MSDIENKKQRLLEIIKKDAIVIGDRQKIVSPDGTLEDGKENWLLDLRNIFLNPAALELIVELFWHRFEDAYPFQVGGQEVAAIPLVSAIVLHSQKVGKPVSGFILRKSRKPYGLQKIIEGKVTGEKIILVDDLMNTGLAKLKQVKVLESIRKKPTAIFVLANFRGERNLEMLSRKDIQLISLFEMEDLGLRLAPESEETLRANFKTLWYFSGPDPLFFHRIHKSTPCLDEEKLYFGTDNSYFWAINQKDGKAAWKFDETGYPVKTGKTIFSSPAILKNTVYFGSYDGNVYALNKETGKLRWKYMDAEFVGSSPAVAENLGLIFIGLEFGLFRKKGALVALNAESGKKVWEHKMQDFVHCSPAYCPEKKVVAVGGNDFYVYLFEAGSGKLKWKYKTGGAIKASLAFDTKRNLLLFGSFDKNMYALDIDSGKVRGKFATKEPIYSTPLIHKDCAYFGSMDKHLYSLDLDTGKLNWHLDVDGRIFARPKVIGGNVYVGSTSGIFYEIDAKTGRIISYFIATERITNEAVYNEKTETFFLSTYANEIYCLKKQKDE